MPWYQIDITTRTGKRYSGIRNHYADLAEARVYYMNAARENMPEKFKFFDCKRLDDDSPEVNAELRKRKEASKYLDREDWYEFIDKLHNDVYRPNPSRRKKYGMGPS